MEKTPFWKKTWFIMLMFFILPPIGIVLMWYGKKEWNKIIRIVLSVIFGLYAILWAIILLDSADEAPSTSSPSETTAYSELNEYHTTIKFETPTREESTTAPTTVEEDTAAVIPTTKKETTTKAPTTKPSAVTKPIATTKKVTTTAKPTTTKAPTTAKPTTTTAPTTKAPATQSSSTEYVLNTNTMRFHKPGCHSVKDINPENKEIVNSNRSVIISQGFEPCGNCHP